MTRKKPLVKQIIHRDMGLCRCCGFKATEVHHIVPLVYGGEDIPTNMISLCDMCHRYAPDNKNDFIDYYARGGARYEMLLGMFANKILEEGLDFHKQFPLFRNMLISLREMERSNMLEKYGHKEFFKEIIPDADLNKIAKMTSEGKENE